MRKGRRWGILAGAGTILVVAWSWLWKVGLVSIPLLAPQSRVHVGGGWYLVYLGSPLGEPSPSTRLIWRKGLIVRTVIRTSVAPFYLGSDCLALGVRGETGGNELRVTCEGRDPMFVAESDFPFTISSDGAEVAQLVDRDRVVTRVLTIPELRTIANDNREVELRTQ